ncbi:MAG: phage terminase large subunit [Magnetococcales bacterium]|nr:phage terminase large subunit [Magnetococcales bacterium]
MNELAADLRQFIEENVGGLPTDEASRIERQKRAQSDYRYFARTYFPHYVTGPDSRLHEWIYESLPPAVDAQEGRKIALAAPRGEAKSTLISQIFTLWCALTGRKRFIPIIADAYDQAAAIMESIKAELEVNVRLKQDYPDQVGEGRVWREGTIITNGNTKVQAFGAGKRMRGLKHGPRRPDMVVIDDLENDENVRSRAQRDKLSEWLSKTVLSLGPADDSLDVFYVGTVLHYDSVLARTLKNPLWEGQKFQAILKWPNRMDLWERWEEILRNRKQGKGVGSRSPESAKSTMSTQSAGSAQSAKRAADAFYREHKDVMDAGAVISWPGVRSLHALMMIRVRDGIESFDSEYQNEPISQNALFSNLHYWVQRSLDWQYFGACDPSMGKSIHGDPSAILVGGYDRHSGVLHVVEASIKRRVPDLIIETIIAFQRQYGCVKWAFEIIQFQEYLKDSLNKAGAAAGVPIPAIGVRPSTDKVARIESLQPYTSDGRICFNANHGVLLDQLRHFPKADHDDGPDALQMLWMVASTSRSQRYQGYTGRGRVSSYPGYRA